MSAPGSDSAARLDRWLAPLLPGPGLDPDASQRARFLAIGALLAAVATLTLIPQLIAEPPLTYRWVVAWFALGGAAITILLVRAGRVERAGYICATVAIGVGAIMEFSEGGAARGNVLIVGVIVAGLLVRPAMALLFTAIAAGIIAGAQLAVSQGWIMPRPPAADGLWLTSIRMIALAGLLVTLLAGTLRRSIDRLRARERDLSRSVRALEEARAIEDAARARLQKAERLEALGRLAGGVAHDFNNLLTVIVGNASLALAHPGDLELLEQIAAAADRGGQLTRQLLAFSRQEPLPPKPVNLHEAAQDLRPLLERLLGEAITIETRFDARDATLIADPGRVDQILVNLAVNAQDAMPKGGTLALATNDVAPGRFRLTVRDTGGGMTPDVRARIFEPFFSTRPSGTGLGLATVRAAVEELGGTIDVDATAGQGTTFVMEFPCAVSRPDDASTSPAPDAATPGATVLLVDDDLDVRATLERSLEHLGYDVLTAVDAESAIAALAAHGGPISVCITDVVLARGFGPELAAAVRERQPGCPVLYMSGYTAGELERHGIDTESGFLAKPFAPNQLGRAVAKLIRSSDPAAGTR